MRRASRTFALIPVFASLFIGLAPGACGRTGLDDGVGVAGTGANGAGTGAAGMGLAGQSGGTGVAGVGGLGGQAAAGDHSSEVPPDSGTQDAIVSGDAGSVSYRALLVATGSSHTCALLDDHNLKCWGDNSYGALGTGDPKNRGPIEGDMGNNMPVVNLGTGRTAKTVSAGRYATCAILDDDTVKCWGWITQAWGEEHATTGGPSFAIGDQASEMGDALPRIDLGSGHTARLLAVGYNSTCAVRDDEDVRCWGSNTPVRDFPAVPGHTISKLIGSDGVLALYEDGTVSAVIGSPPSPPPSVDGGGGVKAVAVAGSLTENCVLWDDGTVTGIDAWSQQDGLDLAIPVLTQLGWPCGVFKDGSVTCPDATGMPAWIGPDAGHGPTVRVGQPVISIAAGLLHLCAALVDGEVKCWTTEDHSVLGLGNSYPTATSWPSVDLGSRRGS